MWNPLWRRFIKTSSGIFGGIKLKMGKMKSKIIKGIIFLMGLFEVQAQDVTLPFELYENKYILIKLPTEKDSLTFYFDTGATTTLLDKETAGKFGLKANYQQKVSGAGGEKIYDVVLNQKIFLTKDKSIDGVHFVLEDLSRLKSLLEKPFDGIIGNDIIKNYVTKIDFKKKQIELYKDSMPEKEGFTGISFNFKNNIPIPQFPITVEMDGGWKFSGDVFFDSGAGLSLLFNAPFVEENFLTYKLGKSFVTDSNNLSNKTKTINTKIKRIKLGSFTFDNVPVALSSDKEGVSSYKEYLGILGSEIINRFDIILDYKDMILYVKPNHLYNNKFEIPVSPIKLKKSENGILISSVVENSEAEKLGLKEGQKIISINGKVTNDIAVYRKMLSQKNKNVVIKYLDGEEEKKIKLKLKELL